MNYYAELVLTTPYYFTSYNSQILEDGRSDNVCIVCGKMCTKNSRNNRHYFCLTGLIGEQEKKLYVCDKCKVKSIDRHSIHKLQWIATNDNKDDDKDDIIFIIKHIGDVNIV